MQNYNYKAITLTGERRAGTVTGESRRAVLQALESQGLIVLKVRSGHRNLWPQRSRIRNDALLFTVREFIAILRAGLTVPATLALLGQRQADPILKGVLDSLRKDVEEGSSLSEACASHRKLFDPLFISAVEIGDRSGKLSDSLEHYQHWLEKKIRLVRKAKQALAYPLFLLLALGLVLGALFSFSLPRFKEMYANMGSELPGPTRLLLDITDYLPWILALAMGIMAILQITFAEQIKAWLHRATPRMPGIGKLVESYELLLLSRNLSAMLSSGASVVDAVSASAAATENTLWREKLNECSIRIKEGMSVADSFEQSGLFPSFFNKITEVGEHAGDLAQQLDGFSQYLDEELDYQLGRAASLIEPMLMLITGVIVGLIVILMYLPIFNVAAVVS